MKVLNRLLPLLVAGTLPVAASAQAAAPDYTFQLKGFVSMTGAMQTGTFSLGEGQQSLAAGAEPTADKNSVAFDVRQSRFNFSVKGPQVLAGATPTGVLEIDFYGGSSAGNFGNVSVFPRMRVAYTQLDWGQHKLQIGQQNDLTFAMAPTSLSHIGFPMGYFTGNIGWRRPGILGFHTIPVAEDLKLELAWQVGRSQYADATTVGGIYNGEASATPAFQGRVTVSGKTYSAFVAGHYSSMDPNGVGVADVDPKAINSTAVAFGGKIAFMGITLQAAGFTGNNTDPLLGNFVEFKPRTVADKDLSAIGYWAQLGYNVTKEFSLWGFYGNQATDKDVSKRLPTAAVNAVRAPSKFDNTTMNVQAMYRDGGVGFSAEYSAFTTKSLVYDNVTGVFASERKDKASQIMATANYFF